MLQGARRAVQNSGRPRLSIAGAQTGSTGPKTPWPRGADLGSWMARARRRPALGIFRSANAHASAVPTLPPKQLLQPVFKGRTNCRADRGAVSTENESSAAPAPKGELLHHVTPESRRGGWIRHVLPFSVQQCSMCSAHHHPYAANILRLRTTPYRDPAGRDSRQETVSKQPTCQDPSNEGFSSLDAGLDDPSARLKR